MLPDINFIAVIVAALVPNILGAIYYGPLFGKTWLASMGRTQEEMKLNNEALVYGVAILCALVVSFFLKITMELVHKEVNDAGELIFGSHHTFGHGALHGAMIAITLVSPVIISMGLFQKASFKNILLNALFWIICFAMMGGILDMWN